MEAEYIALCNFGYLSVRSKSICLANIAYYRVETLFTFRIRKVFNIVSSPIEHRADQVIETRINSGKNGRGSLLDYIDLY